MLEEQINDFIEYCKVSGFRNKSIESSSIRLYQFNNFLKTARPRKIKFITYRNLSKNENIVLQIRVKNGWNRSGSTCLANYLILFDFTFFACRHSEKIW